MREKFEALATNLMSNVLEGLEQVRQAELKPPDTVPDAKVTSVRELRDDLCRTLTGIAAGIESERQSSDPIPDSYLRDFLSPTKQWTKQLADLCHVLSDAENAENNEHKWNNAETWLSTVSVAVPGKLMPCIAALRAAKANREADKEPPDIGAVRAVWAELLDVNEAAKEVLNSLRDIQTEKVIKRSQQGFAKRAGEHGQISSYWFIGFVVSLLAAIGVLSGTADLSPTADATDSVTLFLLRGLLLSIPLIMMKVSLTKFEQERNLSVVYLHRSTVLERYGDIVNSTLVHGASMRDQIMLETARVIFTDPVTGFGKKSAEINFNPVLQSAEKLMRSAS